MTHIAEAPFARNKKFEGVLPRIMDAAPEKVFDDLAWLAAQICRVPIALVSVLGARGQRLKSKVGLTAKEAAREFPICDAIIDHRKLLVVADALQDARLARDPLVTASPKVRFFAGMPLIAADGAVLGTLSIMDRVPRQLSREQIYALEILARQLVGQLESHSELNHAG
ncbi:MAG: multi-sensor signal transduction histidine kinase [Pedosphaera sp.]|nr:multi-sensor signal transduction histidine kinase [Pedosphaera sp.]